MVRAVGIIVPEIIMAATMAATARKRTTLTILLMSAASALAQVPAGPVYDANKHFSPVVTWVTDKDFRKVTLIEAAERAGIETMSLSRDVGERVSVEVAIPPSPRQRLRYAGDEFEATFYPVIRQTYRLKSGKT